VIKLLCEAPDRFASKIFFDLFAVTYMALSKRKRAESDDEQSSLSSSSSADGYNDISSALTGKRAKGPEDEEDDDELADFLRASIAKRSMKEGTRIVKKSKGKQKVTKGEVGGGSFQSMGAFDPAPCDI
jgi:ATP-dependent RNA helicase DDX54/DBP10